MYRHKRSRIVGITYTRINITAVTSHPSPQSTVQVIAHSTYTTVSPGRPTCIRLPCAMHYEQFALAFGNTSDAEVKKPTKNIIKASQATNTLYLFNPHQMLWCARRNLVHHTSASSDKFLHDFVIIKASRLFVGSKDQKKYILLTVLNYEPKLVKHSLITSSLILFYLQPTDLRHSGEKPEIG